MSLAIPLSHHMLKNWPGSTAMQSFRQQRVDYVRVYQQQASSVKLSAENGGIMALQR